MQYNSTATGQTGANVPHDNGKVLPLLYKVQMPQWEFAI